MYTCAMCGNRSCRTGELDNTPLNTPAMRKNKKKLAYYSAQTEAEGYCRKTRLEEIMDFANKCGYKRLGLAFCVGLAKEAAEMVKRGADTIVLASCITRGIRLVFPARTRK